MSNSSVIAVSAQALTKRFPAPDGHLFNAVDAVSLRIYAGELTALVGADGAGKTTLMRLFAGLLTPDAGQLQVLACDICQHPQAVQSQISYMPQRFGLYEDLSVQENLDLYADLHGVPQSVRTTRFKQLLEITDMARFTQRLAGQLSGGMKQKLGLACTLVRSPALLLLDEPSVGVDPLSRRDLWQIVQQLVEKERLSVIISTAYMDEAARCANIIMLHQGKVLIEGAPQHITQCASGLSFSVTPSPEMPARQLQAQLMDAHHLIIDAVPQGGAVHFIKTPHANQKALATLLGKHRAIPRPAALEDAFMYLLRQQQPVVTAALPITETTAIIQENKEPAIIVRDLVRRFGNFTAVASTSFCVARGEIFGLLGPNGAGKTTTFRMLCGLLPASSGYLEVAGVNLRRARAKARARIGYVAQKFSLYGNLSVAENLRFFGAAYGLRGYQLNHRINVMLERFELNAASISGQLPAGFKQRLAMAAALLHEPAILFLDEPTSGIDPLARRAFWHTITALSQTGVTIIITTHFMEEAEYCDRIAIQDAGKLLALGTPHAVRNQVNEQDMNTAFIRIVERARKDFK